MNAAAAQQVRADRRAPLVRLRGIAKTYGNVEAVKPLVEVTKCSLGFFAAGSERVDDPDLAIGTHARLCEKVSLPRLGLVIVDEQQRLGVAQRLSLVKKGVRPHLLTLSATPIPRTLALALRGELLTSTLTELHAGRPPVATTKSRDRAGAVREMSDRPIGERKSSPIVRIAVARKSQPMLPRVPSGTTRAATIITRNAEPSTRQPTAIFRMVDQVVPRSSWRRANAPSSGVNARMSAGFID